MSRPDHSIAGRRILVVEDEYIIAMNVVRWLQAAGFEVIGPVSSVEQALELIEDDHPDGAVLDIAIRHGETVYPVAERLGALGVPYLFATGEAKVSSENGYCERPRLTKPYREAELTRALSALLG